MFGNTSSNAVIWTITIFISTKKQYLNGISEEYQEHPTNSFQLGASDKSSERDLIWDTN